MRFHLIFYTWNFQSESWKINKYTLKSSKFLYKFNKAYEMFGKSWIIPCNKNMALIATKLRKQIVEFEEDLQGF